MSTLSDNVYAITGNAQSEQAETSKANPLAGQTQMRILIELQVQSLMMKQAFGIAEDLRALREDVAKSIT